MCCAACGGLPIVLRPGGVTLEQLRTVLPAIQVYSAAVFGTAMQQRPSTPGMKYRHYAPTAPVTCWEKSAAAAPPHCVSPALVARARADVAASVRAHGYTHIGIITTHAGADSWQWDALALPGVRVELFPIGDERTDLAAVEHGLFDALRTLDARHVDAIFLEGVAEVEQGLAIMNRAKKAASTHIDVTSLLLP